VSCPNNWIIMSSLEIMWFDIRLLPTIGLDKIIHHIYHWIILDYHVMLDNPW
jgi:hypothetical protein